MRLSKLVKCCNYKNEIQHIVFSPNYIAREKSLFICPCILTYKLTLLNISVKAAVKVRGPSNSNRLKPRYFDFELDKTQRSSVRGEE